MTGGNADVSLVGWGDSNNVIASVPLAKETWYMYSVTYDGNVSKIYRNGVLLKAADGIQRSAKGYILNLGKLTTSTSINADIDDIRLYSVAMTDEQVLEAYNSSKAAPANNQTAVSAPASNSAARSVGAPAKTSAPAATSAETTKNGKIIEVFSQGKQIMSANASNIGDLPEGTYLIKVINTNAKK